MSELLQKSSDLDDKPEAAIAAVETASGPEQVERSVDVVPINQVLKLEAPDGKSDEVICYGEETDLGEGVTVSKAQIVPMEIAGLMDKDEPRAKQSKTRMAIGGTVAALMGAGAVISASNGCAVNSEGDNAVKQMKKNLTANDYAHNFQDQGVACFSQAGDGPLSIGTLPNGDKIIVFTRDAGGVDHCFGVTAPDYQTAATQECVAQDIPIPGVLIPGGNPPISSCTADGTRFVAKRGGETVLGEPSVDGSGVISFENEQFNAFIQGGSLYKFVRDGGQQFIVSNKGSGGDIVKQNIDNQTQDFTTVPDTCGLPSKDDAAGVWLGARVDGSNCMVVKSPTLQGLATSIDQIPGISGDYMGPSAGQSIFFFNAADGNHYAIVLPYCGNGICDNGDTQQNCPQDCGQPPVCGDGTQDTGEVCDDGNTTDGDGCSANCQSDETCGNGVVDSITGEVCDDSNNVDGDGCSADCLSDETCGNNVVDVVTGEECDDGNTVSGDGCEANCTDPVPPVCGDGTCEPPETTTSCPDDCEVIPPECEQVLQNVEWTSGQCTLSECDGGNKIAKFSGPCEFNLTLPGGGVVNVEIQGEARVDALTPDGEPLNFGDNIIFSTNGNTFNGKVENGTTAVSGTRVLVGKVQIPGTGNTGITVRLLEDSSGVLIDGELMDTLTAGTDNFEGTWDLTTKERVGEVTNPDAGVDGGTGSDAGVDGGTGADAGTEKPGNPSCTEGCSSSGESNLPAPATLLVTSIVGLLLLRRRKEEVIETSGKEAYERQEAQFIADIKLAATELKKSSEQEETEAPAEQGSGLDVPGLSLYSFVSDRINGALDRIRK